MARRKVDPENSLAVRCPELLKDWDYDLNEYGPEDFDYMSTTVAHWKCHENPEHKWMAVIAKVVTGVIKCPGCNPGLNIKVPKNKPKPGTSLAEVCPEAAGEWYQPYNGTVRPEDVTAGQSHSRYWFKCSKHGTIWMATCCDRKDGKGCSVCRSEKISVQRSTLKPGDSLAEQFPDLTTEWNILLNDTTPDKVFARGRDMVHWICKEGHMWVAPVYNRTCNGAGCNTCSVLARAAKERIPTEGNSLQDRYPLIARELVVSEYGDTDSSKIAYSSGTRCTWRCSICGETVWDATVNSRTARKTDTPGCRECKTKLGFKDRLAPKNGKYLKDEAPGIAAEWDTERNRKELGLELDEIALHSNLDVYWICPRCHESYLMTVNKRTTRGDGCTSCDKSAKASFPEKAILYYVQKAFPDAVGNAKPDIYALGNKEFDIWIPSIKSAVEYDGFVWHEDDKRDLDKEHICFLNNINLIRVRETRCPEYYHMLSTTVIYRNSNRGFKSLDEAIIEALAKLGCENPPDVNTMRDEGIIRKAMHLEFIKGSLAEAYPEVAAQWDYDNNGDLTPWMFRPHSDKKVSWICPNGHGSYTQKILGRTKRGSMCSCETCVRERASLPKKPKPGQSLGDLYPDIATEWRDDLNDGITPFDIGPNSGFVAYWHCPNHEEPYDMAVAHRTKGCGCPYCATPAKRVLPGFNDLATKHPELVDEWDDEKNGDVTPYNILPGSHYEAHWICKDPDCGREWVAAVGSRSMGRGCPGCKNKKIAAAKMKPKDGQSLQDLYEDVAKCLNDDDNGGITALDIRPKSTKRYVWNCSRCGEKFTQRVSVLTKSGRVLCENCKKVVGTRNKGVPRPKPGRSLFDADPILDKFLLPDNNNGLTAHDLSMTSTMMIDWECPNCGGKWTTSPDLMRKRKRKCKLCGYGSEE